PLGQELGLALDGRDAPDHALVEAGRQRLLLDVRDEAVPVRPCDDVGKLLGFRRHEVLVLSVSFALARQCAPLAATPPRPAFKSGGGSGALDPCKSASDTSCRARRMLKLMRCQAWPTRQYDLRSHMPAVALHSVMATGPSSSSMISAALIASGGRARA